MTEIDSEFVEKYNQKIIQINNLKTDIVRLQCDLKDEVKLRKLYMKAFTFVSAGFIAYILLHK